MNTFVRQKREHIYQSLFKVKDKLKEHFTGSVPAPFIGRVGYPYINVGMLSPGEVRDDAWLHDAPRYWSQNRFSLPQIVDLRASLINSRFQAHVKSSARMLSMTQEIGLASKPPEVEVQLTKLPTIAFSSYQFNAPTGPKAELKSAQLTSNPVVSTHVEKVFADIDWKAADGMFHLYKKGFDENFLMKMFSVGNLGVKMQRRLVPTRWSITATDDLIGKQLIEQIKNYSFAEPSVYFGGYQGNYFLFLLFPQVWSYELFEISTGANPGDKIHAISNTLMSSAPPNHVINYTTDHEFYSGRKTYASETVGGYYAARLAVLELLNRIKRQASVIILRFITPSYYLPLGVWVVREAARKSGNSKPIYFPSKFSMIEFAKSKSRYAFNINIDYILAHSLLLNHLKSQKILYDYLK